MMPFTNSAGTVPGFLPGTDLGPCLLASDLAPHRVPGTDLGPCLLASSLAPRRVPGTCLRGRRAEFC